MHNQNEAEKEYYTIAYVSLELKVCFSCVEI